MLIEENGLCQRAVLVMSDMAIMAALIQSTLLEIGKQQRALGEGLLVAAPGDKTGSPNKSVQYLLEGSEYLINLAKQCEEFSSSSSSTSTS